MQIHELKREYPNKKSIKVGRGGKRGKTSGKGHKGQKARAGGKPRPEIRDMIKKLPKLRGRGVHPNKAFKNIFKVVSVETLDKNFKDNEIVSPLVLFKKGLIKKESGKITGVKILGTGELKKKLNIKNCLVSKTAKEKITNSGGKIF